MEQGKGWSRGKDGAGEGWSRGKDGAGERME